MIKRKVRLKITTSSCERLTSFGQGLRANCPACLREVEMLTSTQAAGVLDLDSQTFERLVTGGLVHTIRTVTGTLRVCKDSLFTK